MILKNFIVIEGLDGAGTTTQAEKLVQNLAHAKVRVELDREPSAGPIGRLIRSILQGSETADACSLALLFAADRHEHVYAPTSGVVDRLEDGVTIVCDRYVYSSLAYQGISCGTNLVTRANEHFPAPEHLFFLEVPVSVCLERISARSRKEIFEREAFLQAVAQQYDRVLEEARGNGVTVHELDGTVSSEEIASQIWRIVVETPIVRM